MTSTHDDAPRDETSDGAGEDRETPEVGLVADEDLPEDLQPTEDNPLAQDSSESDDAEDAGPGGSADRADGMPDMGDPSASA